MKKTLVLLMTPVGNINHRFTILMVSALFFKNRLFIDYNFTTALCAVVRQNVISRHPKFCVIFCRDLKDVSVMMV